MEKVGIEEGYDSFNRYIIVLQQVAGSGNGGQEVPGAQEHAKEKKEETK